MSALSVKARGQQKGAALIMVLLMVGTLSVVTLSMVTAMSSSAKRSFGAVGRSELLWRAVSAEAIAGAVIGEAIKRSQSGGFALTAQHPLFSQQLDIPYADGGGAIIFADATRCFNLNSLVDEGINGNDAAPALSASKELLELLKGIGLADVEARSLAAVAKDFVDRDNRQEIGGAEDGFYAGLPTPFRTAGGPIASVTELKSMKGIHSTLYESVKPHLCALPTTQPVKVNVNTLRPEDAPVIVGLSGGALEMDDAAKLIETRPPTGWESVEAFVSTAETYANDLDRDTLTARIALKPAYIEAIAGATVNEIDTNVRLLFWVSEGGDTVGVISRELGTDS